MKKISIILSASILSLSMVTPALASNASTLNVIQASQSVSSIKDPITIQNHSKNVKIVKYYPTSEYVESMIPLSISYSAEVQDGYYGILKLSSSPKIVGSNWTVVYSGTVQELD
ncbi:MULTISPECIES: hypothetical protein [Paenibacillus]|uniref:hypothetical protein n=1 Tax=Paenibacillus TaxID=44249 RepID=UPI00037B673C|nr:MULTISPECIES: hypothetical protein [Paenibacillus]APO46910.1 hypothetical protein BS614_24610 [Paenibacillus xylanexedens]